MKKNLQLTIPTPCHEDWDKMTPNEKGKFCSSCQKTVVDFTNMSDSQVAAFFKKPSTGSVCGRFMNDQLDRNIVVPKKRLPWIKYFWHIIIPAFLVSCKSFSGRTVGKVAPINMEHENENRNITVGIILSDIDTNYDTVVFPLKPETVSNAIPSLPRVDSHEDWMKDTITFSSDELQVDEQENLENNGVVKELEEVILTGLGYKRYGCGIMGAVTMVKGNVIKIDSVQNKTPLPPSIPVSGEADVKVYPNPVNKGSEIKIAFKDIGDGEYSISLYSISGQLIQQRQVSAKNKEALLRFSIPGVSPGAYILSILNNGRRFSEKIIVH